MSGLFGGGSGAPQDSPVSSLYLQTSTRGRPIPIAYGKTRINGNLVWYGDLIALAHEQQQGGKGGSGAPSTVTYTYTASLVYALCEGSINAVPTIWRDKEVYTGTLVSQQAIAVDSEAHFIPGSLQVAVANQATFTSDVAVWFDNSSPDYYSTVQLIPGTDYTVSNGVYTFLNGSAGYTVYISYTYTPAAVYQDACGQLGLAYQQGSFAQSPYGWLSSAHPDQAIAYRGTAIVGGPNYALLASAHLQNHSFEVDTQSGYSGSIRDANPKDVIIDLLTNQTYGCMLPASRLGDYTNFSNYCVANNIFVSPAYTEQLAARDILAKLLTIANCGPVFSDGVFKIIPYGDVAASANGVSFTPNTTPLYNLTDDDFLGDNSEDPIKVSRKSNADAYNHVQVTFLNRANSYNEEIAEAKDDANIQLFGLRTIDQIELKEVCDPAIARTVAQIILQRTLYIRNTYEFKLGWRYALLEPMDLVTLTDTGLGMNQTPVRIVSVEENDFGDLTVTAEEFPANVSNAALYSTQSSLGFKNNFNVVAPSVNAPVFVEPPDQLVNDLELWAAVSGSGNYGGCNVFVSYDSQTYKKVGTIQGSARTGYLTAQLPQSSASIDKANTLSVDLTESGATLLSGTQDDANNNRTLCFVDGELISYATATLTAANKYNLTYLNRDAYGTANALHKSGARFARMDDSVFKLSFEINDIGRTVYLKFQSFNQYGSGMQDLASLQPYSYTFQGSALNSPLPNVANVSSNFVSGVTNIIWDVVNDFRTPLDYEIRIGATWSSGRVVTRTPLNKLPCIGDGTYWVAAHYKAPNGVEAYSATPQSIVISGAVLLKNVLVAYDQAANGWNGTLTAPAALVQGNVQLMGAGNILTDADFLNEPSVLWYGGVSLAQGIYQVPASNRVNVGRVAACNVVINLSGFAQSIVDNFLGYGDVLNVTDVFGSYLGPKITLQPQIRIAQADGVYGAWQNYVPGQYSAQYFDARVLLSTSDPQVYAVLSGFVFTVDVPDRLDTGNNVALAAGGATVTFSKPFNGGPNASGVPLVQAVILNAQQGDYIVLSAPTLSGFTVQVMNAGSGVARNINWTAQGY